jgi:hypothetical protein
MLCPQAPLVKLIALLLALAQPRAPGLYPDAGLTPGHVMTTDRATVCRVGYTKTVRSVSAAERREVFARYGIAEHFGDYEVDHFISLELGGSNDLANLWPEPYAGDLGARKKDVVETSLHRRVCKGALSLAEAVKIITTDWVAEYQRIKAVR